ncbi:MAG: phosphate-starvation-inducible PsiE family protein [Candidatus Binatia bacterium]
MRHAGLRSQWRRFDAVVCFNHGIDLIFKLLIFFVVLVLAMGLIKLFWEVWRVMAVSKLTDAFGFIITHLLTFFIILELFKSLVEYFREHRLKLTFIVDATLVFILREVMIGLYQHQSSPLQISALALLALVLGAVRTLAIVYSPMERKMLESLRGQERPNSPRSTDEKQSGSRLLESAAIQ